MQPNVCAAHGGRRCDDDLHSGCPLAAARTAAQRPAVFGDLEPHSDCVLRDFGADFPCLVPGAVGARGHRGVYEAGAAPPPRGGRGDPPARAATGLSALTLAETGLSALTLADTELPTLEALRRSQKAVHGSQTL